MTQYPPQQARSQKTLEKILDACDRLLVDRTFDQITMQALAGEAGVSVGSLYTRFSDRDALVARVVDRHQQRFLVRFQRELASEPRPEALRDRLRRLAHLFQSGLAELRAVFVLLATQGGDPRHGGTGFSRAGTDRVLDTAVEWLTPRAGEDDRPADREVTRRCIASMAIQLQYDLLFRTASRLVGDALPEFLADQAYAVLGGSTREQESNDADL